MLAESCYSPSCWLLMQSHLRAMPDLLITCSDVSHSGAGVVGSSGLTEMGVQTAIDLPHELPSEKPRGFILLSMFAGIEAVRRALDLLGIKPPGVISPSRSTGKQPEIRLKSIRMPSHFTTLRISTEQPYTRA